MPDSKPIHKDFFCSGCQSHKKGKLLSHKIKNRSYCTTCAMPIEAREEMGILNPYENTAKQQASIKHAAKVYAKPISKQSLQAMTGEYHDTT